MKNIFAIIKNSKYAKKRYIVFFLIFILFVAYAIFSPYGIVNRIVLENTKRGLKVMIEDERLKTDSLHNQIKLLENDDYEVEKIAREKYGMVKPGEKVFFKSQIDSVKK